MVSVVIDDTRGCSRYTVRVIGGLSIGPSPRWLRRRLEAVGVRPISNLVDVTSYVMFGQPPHS
jgi:phenylalanyl-tRNA synthetase beta chain